MRLGISAAVPLNEAVHIPLLLSQSRITCDRSIRAVVQSFDSNESRRSPIQSRLVDTDSRSREINVSIAESDASITKPTRGVQCLVERILPY